MKDFFPGSNKSLCEFSEIKQKTCVNRSNCKVIDLCLIELQEVSKGKWRDFYNDHFHPNIFGYQKIVSAIAVKVIELIKEISI